MRSRFILIFALILFANLILSSIITIPDSTSRQNASNQKNGQEKTNVVSGDVTKDKFQSEQKQDSGLPKAVNHVFKFSVSDSSKSQATQNTSTQQNQTVTQVPNLGFSSSTSSNEVPRISFSSSFDTLGKRSDEVTYRNLVLGANRKSIQQHNSKPQVTFYLAENQFSQLTVEQFSSLYLTLRIPINVASFQINIKRQVSKIRLKSAQQEEDSSDSGPSPKPSPQPTPPSPTPPSPTPPSPTPPSPTPPPPTPPSPTPPQPKPTPPTPTPNTTINVDWVAFGMVTPVKNQGSCGSCYAFATYATLQSALLMKNKTLYANIDLSEQQIVDCSARQGNAGCNGGWLSSVFEYVLSFGTTTEASYPYIHITSNCKSNGGTFKIASYKGGDLNNNCTALTNMVKDRPVSIAVSAGNQYWMSYSSGIMNVCGSGRIDHAVTVTGVFQDATQNYWKIRNSWGTFWGEKGYIRIDRNQNSLCQLCSYGYYPVL